MCSIVVRAGMFSFGRAADFLRAAAKLSCPGRAIVAASGEHSRTLNPHDRKDNSNYLQLFRGFLTSKGRMVQRFRLTTENKKGTIGRLSQGRRDMDPDKRNAWLRKLDEECPYQVVLPRRQLADDSAIMNFLMNYVGKFDMYVEDEYAAFVRYCFADPLDAAIFRSRFEPKAERLKLAG